MKISKEFKIGVLGTLALAVFYFGFNFLKGLDFLSSSNEYYLYLSDVQGLGVSSPVTYKGVKVGRVLSLEPEYKGEGVKIVIDVKEDIKLTSNTAVTLSDDGLIGGKILKLDIVPGSVVADGGKLTGTVETSFTQTITKKLDPTLRNADSLLINLNKVVKEYQNSGRDLKNLMTSASQTSAAVNSLLAANAVPINKVVVETAVLTRQLNVLSKNLDAQLKPILSKAHIFTDSLSQIRLGETVNQLNSTVSGLKGLLTQVQNGQGTAGKFLSDDSLYIHLENSSNSLNLLFEDLKKNPGRYVHFSLFGGKDKSDKTKKADK